MPDDATPPAMDQIAYTREQNIGRLFLQAHRDFSERALVKLRARGHDGLGPAHMALLPHLEIDGTRITTLAERMQVSKQAAGQLVNDLELKGYVARGVDPHDGRAMRVTFTDGGRQFLRDAYTVKHEIEAEYRTILGDSGMEALQDALTRLVHGPEGV